MDSRVVPLTVRYPMISPAQFEKILKNQFRPYNIVKLIREHLPLSKEDDNDDAAPADTKSMTHLIRCLLVYCQVLIELTLDSIKLPLQAALATYQDHLLDYSQYYIFESVRSYHFQFHERRIATMIDDPRAWATPDSDLHTRTLVQ